MSRRRSRHLSSRGGDAADPCEREAGRHGHAHEQRWLAPSQAAEVAQQALQIIVAQRVAKDVSSSAPCSTSLATQS